MTEFERHSFYHAVLEAMREKGCPLCRLTAQASHRYLDGILYEAVTAEDFRAKFRAARGFCPRHAREVAGFDSALGTSMLYEEVMVQTLERWEKSVKQGAPRPPKAKCPACATEDGLTANFVETVFGHIADAGFLEAYRGSDGLCVGHFETVLAKASAKSRAALVNMERDKLALVVKRLNEFIRKCDYRFAHEPVGEEGRAWLDAIRKSAGGAEDV